MVNTCIHRLTVLGPSTSVDSFVPVAKHLLGVAKPIASTPLLGLIQKWDVLLRSASGPHPLVDDGELDHSYVTYTFEYPCSVYRGPIYALSERFPALLFLLWYDQYAGDCGYVAIAHGESLVLFHDTPEWDKLQEDMLAERQASRSCAEPPDDGWPSDADPATS